jgi:acyl-CoA thioesterase-1
MVISNSNYFAMQNWAIMGCRKFSAGYRFQNQCVNIMVCLVGLLLSFQVSAERPVKIVMLGDSLTAGYGLVKGQSVPAQLEKALRAESVNVKIINAGVSGDTSAGGLARISWALVGQPDGLIIELGANDGLRGLDPKQTFRNLNAIIEHALSAHIKVLLTGMLAPPNLGTEYGKDFNSVYPLLARHHGLELYPFYLKGIVSDPLLNLEDGLHPNEKGVAVIVKNLMPKVKILIAKIKK